MYEISLTRIFSVRLWYHFAFMVISIAMLGIGSAGTLLAVLSLRKQSVRNQAEGLLSKSEGRPHWIYSEANIPLYAALTGISVMLCYVISNHLPFDPVKFSWDNKQFLYLAIYCLLLSVPFFFSGLLIAAVFSMYSEKSMLVYGSDLLGAGIGSLSVLYLLNVTSPEHAILAASTLSLAGALATGRKNVKLLALTFLSLNLLAFMTHPGLINVNLSPYKRLSLFLKYPGAEYLDTYHSPYSRIDTFRSPAVRFAPGLSLQYLDPLPDQIGLAIDGDSVSVITSAEDKTKLRFLEFLPSSIAYELRGNGDVMVIDPKGGLQVLMAGYYGSRKIDAVESNPMIFSIITNNYSEFSGGIYGSHSHTGHGRNHINLVRERAGPEFAGGAYDVIDIPMTDTSVSGLFGISEDYRFTVEAFKIYLSALKEDGILTISTYLIPPPRTEFRLLGTLISAFNEISTEDVLSRTAAVRSWDSMTLIAKKTPFNSKEIETIRAFCRERRFDPVYYPGITGEETNKFIKMPVNEYFTGFTSLLDSSLRKPFADNYLFDIKPVRDDNPFFNYYLKFNNIKPIYNKMGRNWLYFIEEGYILPIVFVIILLLCIVLILLPVVLNALRREQILPPSALTAFIYFSMLGAGFMLVEVSLIQKTLLVLENPAYTLAVILASILISSGLGSMLSSRLPELKTHYSPLIISAVVLGYSMILPSLMDALSSHILPVRMIVLAVLMVPMGFLMGIPFPAGLKILGRQGDGLIPWAWAINACISVLAPILTIMLALVTGFRTVLWVGAAAYFMAFVALLRLRKL